MLIIWILVFIASLALIVKSADWLVESAEKIGLALKISPFIIGVTIVAIGTSFPELASTLTAARNLLKRRLDEISSELTPRERRILAMRFGLEDGISHTLEEVGKEFGVTRERIRQIQAKALERIRQFRTLKKLKDY